MSLYSCQVKTSDGVSWEFWEGVSLYSSCQQVESYLIELIEFMNFSRGKNETEVSLENYRIVLIDPSKV